MSKEKIWSGNKLNREEKTTKLYKLLKNTELYLLLILGSVTTSVHAKDSEFTLELKSKQWINKERFFNKAVDYILDIYVSDAEEKDIEIYPRTPETFFTTKNPNQSKHFHKSLNLTGSEDDIYLITLPKGKKINLSSYFKQAPRAWVNSTTFYCNSPNEFTAKNDRYILDLNFIKDGLISGSCSSELYTLKEYEESKSFNKEKTEIDGLSRKELSLRFGSLTSAKMASIEISRNNDYQNTYIQAATDRLAHEFTMGKKEGIDALAWMARIISESRSDQHLTAAKEAMKKNANPKVIKKLKRYFKNTSTETVSATLHPIEEVENYSLERLKNLATIENLSADNKTEIEGAARDIIETPNNFGRSTYDIVEKRLTLTYLSVNDKEIAASIWLVRALSTSKDNKYIDTLELVKNSNTHKKLKKEASTAIKEISKYRQSAGSIQN